MFYGQCVSIIPSSARLSVLNRKLEVEQQQHLSQFMIVLRSQSFTFSVESYCTLAASCTLFKQLPRSRGQDMEAEVRGHREEKQNHKQEVT